MGLLMTTSHNLMNYVFYGFLNKLVVVYLDDIIIYSEFFKDHLSCLELVFSRLRENLL